MNSVIAMLLLAAMLAACPLALAEENTYCDMPPQAILERFEQEYDRAELGDYIAFQMPDGSVRSFLITTYGFMDGYRYEDGEWSVTTQVSPVDSRWQPRFVRHDPAVPRADGSFYPDALGFDLVCEETGDRISYHYTGTDFTVCGWRSPSVYDGEVILEGREAMYYPAGQREAEAVCFLGKDADSIMLDFGDLPFTPQEGAAMAAITEEAIAAYFPGYVLREVATYNAGHETAACYSRVEDGLLYVKRATFESGRQPEVSDCMPVPLSASLLERLETEGFDGKLSLMGSGSLFCTENALDTAAISAPGRIVDSDLQRHALLLLTEDDAGVRRLCVVTQSADGYDLAATPALPEGVYLDIFHAGDGDVQFEWSVERQGETQYRSASYRRLADGTWRLSWARSSAPSFEFSAAYCGLREEWNYGSTEGIRFGSFPNGDLMQADLSGLPVSHEELDACLDRSGWAVVCNPNPADRLHLRVKPDRGAESLGKFYNGTPVQVIRQQGDWCEVTIGLDGCLTGWMMKRYLVFGEAMDDVACAFPAKCLREEHEGRPLYTSQELTGEHELAGEYWVVGVVGDELYIVLTESGGTGYAPQAWFWEGNG